MTKSGLEAKLAIISSGQGFGEMSLLTGSNHINSIRTLTKVTLYKLSKRDFEDILQHETAFKKALRNRAAEFMEYNKIKILQPFVLLEPDKMFAIMARMEERTYGFGEDIIVQGEKGDYYYIIKSGRVAVLKKSRGDWEDKQVAVLGEGFAFGEEALIRDDPRNATCQAIEETVVYALDRWIYAGFTVIVLDNIFAEDIRRIRISDKYVVIDARVPQGTKKSTSKGP
jgi:CRP-like cAMP-binding protein